MSEILFEEKTVRTSRAIGRLAVPSASDNPLGERNNSVMNCLLHVPQSGRTQGSGIGRARKVQYGRPN